MIPLASTQCSLCGVQHCRYTGSKRTNRMKWFNQDLTISPTLKSNPNPSYLNHTYLTKYNPEQSSPEQMMENQHISNILPVLLPHPEDEPRRTGWWNHHWYREYCNGWRIRPAVVGLVGSRSDISSSQSFPMFVCVWGDCRGRTLDLCYLQQLQWEINTFRYKNFQNVYLCDLDVWSKCISILIYFQIYPISQ